MRLPVFLWIFCCGLGFECTIQLCQYNSHHLKLVFIFGKMMWCAIINPNCLLDFLLSPFKVSFDLLGRFCAVRKIGTSTFETALGKSLQIGKFALFGVQLTGSRHSVSEYSGVMAFAGWLPEQRSGRTQKGTHV